MIFAKDYRPFDSIACFVNWRNILPQRSQSKIKGRINKGELTHEHKTHQTVQMDEMAENILGNKQPVVPVDGEEGLKDLKIWMLMLQ